jgi:peptidoglycan/LPS O-acetylase OafA/YrhL
LTLAALRWTGPFVWNLGTSGIIGLPAVKWLTESGDAPVIALMVGVFATGRGVLSYLLSSRVMVLLGEISFSIYMTHEILLRIFVQNHNLSVLGGILIQYIVYWIIVLSISLLMWAFVEKPCRKRALEFFDRSASKRPRRTFSLGLPCPHENARMATGVRHNQADGVSLPGPNASAFGRKDGSFDNAL